MTRRTLALITLLSTGCYERTLVVADAKDTDAAVEVDVGDDAAPDDTTPDVVDENPPIFDAGDVAPGGEDAAQPVVDGGPRPRRECRQCNIDRSMQCLPPLEHVENLDCVECGCCTSDAMCAEFAPRFNLSCVGLRGGGIGFCAFNFNGGGPDP
jgi:hypothetical protein